MTVLQDLALLHTEGFRMLHKIHLNTVLIIAFRSLLFNICRNSTFLLIYCMQH